MTSNLGATQLQDEKTVGFGAADMTADYQAMSAAIKQQLKLHFRPEFLNRIDETIIFHSLNQKELHQIVKLLADKVKQRMAERDIKVRFTPGAIDVIAKAGYDPEYGARPLRRSLQNLIEDPLSEALLAGAVQTGDEVVIGSHQGKITLKDKRGDAKPELIALP